MWHIPTHVGRFRSVIPRRGEILGDCQSEIDQLRSSRAGNQDVGHFHVAVGQTLGEGIVQAPDDFKHNPVWLPGAKIFLRILMKSRRFPPSDELHGEADRPAF